MTVDAETGEPEPAAQWEIVTINPDRTGEQIVSAGDPETIRATRLEDDRAPAWSPDSATIVFMTQSVDPCCTPWQIVEVRRDGTDPLILSEDPAVDDFAPSYAPDGRTIVFVSARDAEAPGETDVYTMAAPRAGAAAFGGPAPAAIATRLTTSGNAVDPAWGRDAGSPSPPAGFALTVRVNLARDAKGRVLSAPAGIDCKGDCAETFSAGTLVQLRASPVRRSKFAGWSDACSGTALRCVVTMSKSRRVTAKFVPN
jgi:hypothetical protein